ncbi:MAG: AGE family epimerase/isomerase [Oscillospiraceae bacterium]|nr:AGE family epimerase/isomerase [Oscillospiraceae bacterium]
MKTIKNLIKIEMNEHLCNELIPFWNRLADYENGGFYGYVSHDGKIDKTYPKGAVLNLRILWFYSKCYIITKDENCLKMAKHCYDFIVKHFIDNQYGGIYWLVSAKGTPIDTMKHSYSHAFFIYAMSNYYEASGDVNALKYAYEQFRTFHKKNPDYTEACERKWERTSSTKTTGAILHLIESFTELYRVCLDIPQLKKLECSAQRRVERLLELVYYDMYESHKKRLPEIFDNRMNKSDSIYSYGHFVEAAWLIGGTLDVMKGIIPIKLESKIRQMNHDLIETADTFAFATTETLMCYDEKDKIVNRRKAWWTQAEGIVGFLDDYKRFGSKKSLYRAVKLWDGVKSQMLAREYCSQGVEWINELDENAIPDKEMPLVNEWKCPYHTGRMALWVLENL